MLLWLLSGCGRGAGVGGDDSEGATSGNAGSEHEHDHHHHSRPTHKPDDFTELPQELQRRLIADESGRVRPSRRRLRQLADIVSWIPELAADSELRRAGFEQALAQQVRLQRVLDALTAGDAADMAEWNAAIAQLQQLADSLGREAEGEPRRGSAE
ncbi:MAG: hypothetical protein ACKO2P_15560 [Planctomycetota bacterium]